MKRDRDRSRWGEKDGKREEMGESEIGHDEGGGINISRSEIKINKFILYFARFNVILQKICQFIILTTQ